MNDALSRPMVEAMRAISSHPAAASDIGIEPKELIKLVHRGFAEADRKPFHPNIYRITPRGEALVELLNAPIVFYPSDGPVRRIQQIVASHFSIPLVEMWSQRRSRGVARPRQVAMYFARELTPMSLPNIGQRFGKRDHTTVIHAIRKVEELIAANSEFAADINVLREALEQ